MMYMNIGVRNLGDRSTFIDALRDLGLIPVKHQAYGVQATMVCEHGCLRRTFGNESVFGRGRAVKAIAIMISKVIAHLRRSLKYFILLSCLVEGLMGQTGLTLFPIWPPSTAAAPLLSLMLCNVPICSLTPRLQC